MGYSVYKVEDFIATSDMTLGYNKHLNRYTGTFITTLQIVLEESIILDINEVPRVYPKKLLHFLLIIMALPIGHIWKTTCAI